MNGHRHLSSEEICERMSEKLPLEGIAGCAPCEAEALSLARLFGDLRRADAGAAGVTDWDDLLLRRRIREAVARERPHSRSIFDRFAILRPALVSALVAGLVLAVWSPLPRRGDGAGIQLAAATASSRTSGHLPSWTPLPDEALDEGLDVLAEWTPNEDELTIARCRAACLGGLSLQEEEDLFREVAAVSLQTPPAGSTPL